MPGASRGLRRRGHSGAPRDAHASVTPAAATVMSPLASAAWRSSPCGFHSRSGPPAVGDVCVFSGFRRPDPSPPCAVHIPASAGRRRRGQAPARAVPGSGLGDGSASPSGAATLWCAAVRLDPVAGGVIPNSHLHPPRRPPRALTARVPPRPRPALVFAWPLEFQKENGEWETEMEKRKQKSREEGRGGVFRNIVHTPLCARGARRGRLGELCRA